MAQLPKEELSRYAHSPVHLAVASKDHGSLRQIIAGFPKLSKGGTILTEEDAIEDEQRAEDLSKEIDRRDVLGRDTPLHLAVRVHDPIAAEILLAAGADSNLQNEQGWNALQEAVCAREEAIALLITKYYQPLAWAKWCRRAPRVVGAMKRMIDFYMEFTFHFESAVIPFIGKIAPSDTYKIWKKGSNMRADMTIAGFDGLKIQRSDQSVLFLGERSNARKLPGSLYMLKHAKKCVVDMLEGAGRRPSESEAAREVAELSSTNMYRPGLDVTQAILIPQLTWRRQERSDMVGKWKTKVYDMHHVQLSLKSRRVPGALTDEELFWSDEHDIENGEAHNGLAELLDEDERRQLDKALDIELEEDNGTISDDAGLNVRASLGLNGMDGTRRASFVSGADLDSKHDRHNKALGTDNRGAGDEISCNARHSIHEVNFSSKSSSDATSVSSSSDLDRPTYKIKKGLGPKQDTPPLRMGCSDDETKSSLQKGYMSAATGCRFDVEDIKGKNNDMKSKVSVASNGNKENEYKMGVRPVLWLTPDFPLKTDEMLPLLDIMADKVKAVRRLREVLTTKLPAGTFPVKVAIPIIPTIKVIITFTKFEQLHGNEAFAAPRGKDVDNHGSSWFSTWRKGATKKVVEMPIISKDSVKEAFDPFVIPDDYEWMGNAPRKA